VEELSVDELNYLITLINQDALEARALHRHG